MSMLSCFGCGVEKDPACKEVYTFEPGRLTDDPTDPLFVVECQGVSGYRAVVVCHACFSKLDVDLWIDEAQWQARSPRVPYCRCPLFVPDLPHDRSWDAATYTPLPEAG